MNYAYESKSPENSWHSDTIERFKTLSLDSLEYIKNDAKSAAIAGESIYNPKARQYWDEYFYACAELKRRAK